MEDKLSDDCKVKDFENYKPEPLGDAAVKEFESYYTFKEGEKKFKVTYKGNEKRGKAFISEIKADKLRVRYKTYKETNQFDMTYLKEISGMWYGDHIRILNVYLGDAKGKGLCSRAVGYLIKVLLLEAAKLRKFPFKAGVHIYSGTPCAAVNCYTHAFMMNGFQPDDEDIKRFAEEYEKAKKEVAEDKWAKYPHVNLNLKFTSESQKVKHQESGGHLGKRHRVNTNTVQLKLKY